MLRWLTRIDLDLYCWREKLSAWNSRLEGSWSRNFIYIRTAYEHRKMTNASLPKNTLQQRDFSTKLEHTSSPEFSLLLSFNVTQKSRISPTQSFSALNARPKKCKMKSCSLLLCGGLSLVVTGSRTLVLHGFNSFLVFRILFIFHCSSSFR